MTTRRRPLLSTTALALALCCGPVRAQQTPSYLTNLINTGIYTNSSGAITAPVMQNILNQMNASYGNLLAANTWAGQQTFSSLTGTIQCLQVNSFGVLSGTGSTCGGSGSGMVIGNPVTGGTPGYGLYVNGATLGQFAYGTGIFTALGVNIGSAGAPVLFNGAGGTPSSVTLTNGAGLPVSTGISGLGAGVATALGVAPLSTGSFTPQNGAITNGDCLKWSTASGVTDAGSACGSGSGSPGGANTNVQFNSSGSFGGDSGFTYGSGAAAISTSLSVGGGTIGSNTVIFDNTTPSTGETSVVVQGGAHQATSNNPTFQANNYSGSSQFVVTPLGIYVPSTIKLLGSSCTGYACQLADFSQILQNSYESIDFVSGPAPTDNAGHGFFNMETAANNTATSGSTSYMWFGTDTGTLGFAPTNGTAVFNGIWANWEINQTGGANGITRGVYVNNTIAAAADYRGIEVSNVGSSQTALKTGTGKVVLGDALTIAVTGSTQCLHVNTSGVVSGTGSDCGSGGGGTLTVGTTATSGGAAGQLMYDSGTVLQESVNLLYASNILQVGQSTTAQSFRVANTWSSSGTNYEYGIFDWQTTTNTLTIGTTNGGTGLARNLQFVVGGTNKLDYGVTNTNSWTTASNVYINSGPGLYVINSGKVRFGVTGTPQFALSNDVTVTWATGDAIYSGIDTGLSRISAGVLGLGNGTASDVSGTLKLAIVTPSTGITGVTTGSNASAGYVGEIISSSVGSGSAVSQPTSGTAINITSVSLSAGDWDCEASVITNPAGTTTTSLFKAGMSGTSVTLPTPPAGGYAVNSYASAAGVAQSVSLARTQYNVSGLQSVYLVGNATFAISTMSLYGQISCRRVR